MNNAAAERFELRVGDELAVTMYSLVGRSLFLAYTDVPDRMTEQGLDRTLLRGALEHARARGLTVVPICPIVRAFLEEESEYQELVREKDL